VQSEVIETPYGGSGETDVSAQIVSELGEARAPTGEGSEGPGEIIDILESARCVIHELVAECMYDSSEDETLMHDKYVSPRSRFGQVRCDSTAEISLRNKYEVLQQEEVVSTPDEEEIVDPIPVKRLAAKQSPKKGIRKPASVEKDIEEIVRELDEEAPMTASMAFMRACLASPAGVKLSHVPVPTTTEKLGSLSSGLFGNRPWWKRRILLMLMIALRVLRGLSTARSFLYIGFIMSRLMSMAMLFVTRQDLLLKAVDKLMGLM
jgi:hypothetical protein